MDVPVARRNGIRWKGRAMAKIEKKYWTLLALASAKGESLSPVQLQKTLFLFGRKMPAAVKHDYYNFIPYNYGPFDPVIYSDAEVLTAESLVVLQERPGCRWSEYAATPRGIALAEKIKNSVPGKELRYLDGLVEWVRSLSFRDLLRTVYAEYPDYAVNSVFRE
jgi:hypothetical protein